MKERRNPVVMKWWLAWVLLMALLLPTGVAGNETDLDDQLRKAARSGDLALVKSLIGRGADIQAETRDGVTILMSAAIGGHVEVVRFLVDQGLDVNAKTINGDFSVLVWASLADNLKVVQFLTEQGADVNAKDSHGNTVLDLAKLWHRTEIVKYLESRGAE